MTQQATVRNDRDGAAHEVPDELLMAFADGVLEPAEAARIEAILKDRPDLQHKVGKFRQTGVALQRAFDEVLDAPVPEQLLAAIRQTPAERDNVVPLQRDRAVSVRRSGSSGASTFPWRPIAMAASVSLVVGALAAWYVKPAPGAGAATIVAQGSVRQALETGISGTALAVGAVRVTPLESFVAKDKSFCRQYEVSGADTGVFGGVACRTDDGSWQVKVHIGKQQPRANAGRIAPAGRDNGSDILNAFIDREIEGGALDPAEELRAIERKWQR